MIIALAGLPGAGKTTSASILKELGFRPLRFGDITDIMLKKEGRPINEQNERYMREHLREQYGMGAYASLNISRVRKLLPGDVVIDGMRSWDEFRILREEFGNDLKLVAIDTSPKIRHKRLSVRGERGLTVKEAQERDAAEIKNLGVDEPVKRASLVIDNNGSSDELRQKLIKLVARF